MDPTGGTPTAPLPFPVRSNDIESAMINRSFSDSRGHVTHGPSPSSNSRQHSTTSHHQVAPISMSYGGTGSSPAHLFSLSQSASFNQPRPYRPQAQPTFGNSPMFVGALSTSLPGPSSPMLAAIRDDAKNVAKRLRSPMRSLEYHRRSFQASFSEESDIISYLEARAPSPASFHETLIAEEAESQLLHEPCACHGTCSCHHSQAHVTQRHHAHPQMISNESTPLLQPQQTHDYHHFPYHHDDDKTGGPFAWFFTFLRFVGPGFMVGVGYLDPGNWATDLAAGSQYGYALLYIVVTASVVAMLLQYLCIKLGVVTGLDLAMACRRYLPPWMNLLFYGLCELAIIATDCAEVVGTAIALNLLFKIPLVWGVALTGFDVLIILALWDQRRLRTFETAIMLLIMLVAACFVYLLTVSKPHWGDVLIGLLPTTEILADQNMLYLAMSVVGATIMPHNLYLHSSIVKYRASPKSKSLGEIADIDEQHHNNTTEAPPVSVTNPTLVVDSTESQPWYRRDLISLSLWYCNMDSIMALSGALLVNSAILIVAGASFFNNNENVAELKDAYELLTNYLGPLAGVAFAVGLLCAGQSSTITGTLSGQIVMEGFLGPSFVVAPWLQRLVTRACAIIPAMTVAIISGESGVNSLLVFSQVVLSLQLPFAVWPLVWVTCDAAKMTVTFKGEVAGKTMEEKRAYANSWTVAVMAFAVAVLISLFNVILIIQVFAEPPEQLKALFHW